MVPRFRHGTAFPRRFHQIESELKHIHNEAEGALPLSRCKARYTIHSYARNDHLCSLAFGPRSTCDPFFCILHPRLRPWLVKLPHPHLEEWGKDAQENERKEGRKSQKSHAKEFAHVSLHSTLVVHSVTVPSALPKAVRLHASLLLFLRLFGGFPTLPRRALRVRHPRAWGCAWCACAP